MFWYSLLMIVKFLNVEALQNARSFNDIVIVSFKYDEQLRQEYAWENGGIIRVANASTIIYFTKSEIKLNIQLF